MRIYTYFFILYLYIRKILMYSNVLTQKSDNLFFWKLVIPFPLYVSEQTEKAQLFRKAHFYLVFCCEDQYNKYTWYSIVCRLYGAKRKYSPEIIPAMEKAFRLAAKSAMRKKEHPPFSNKR